MKEFADEDEVCREAIAENEVVMTRIRERVELCKTEVESRGMRWTGEFWKKGVENEAKVNGEISQAEESTGDGGGDGLHL